MVTREDMIEQSVSDYVREELAARGYDDTLIQVREAFPTQDERSSELTVSQLAIGFNFDDGGTPMELGSNLTMFVHTIELWVFGTEPGIGRNIAHVVRTILLAENYTVPLKDVSDAAEPVIDMLVVDKAAVNRQIAHDPRPWDMYVWTCTARVEDTYYPT
jgi:hypothetical protein